MPLMAPVENGELVETNTGKLSDSTKKTEGGSTLGKEAFLQLLVAQMKYQDPLEPTSNTEYIAQLATFSQLEATQNLEASMEAQKAASLVGQPVIMKTTSSSTGDTYYTAGYVNAMIMSDGEPYLYIASPGGGGYYHIDDLDTVLTKEYYEEYLNSNVRPGEGEDGENEDGDTDTDDTVGDGDSAS